MNPLTTLPKLIKSKPMVDHMEKDFRTMNKTNWKTNTIGIITLAVGLAALWAPSQYQPKIAKTATLLAGAGLLAAKDNDK